MAVHTPCGIELLKFFRRSRRYGAHSKVALEAKRSATQSMVSGTHHRRLHDAGARDVLSYVAAIRPNCGWGLQ